MSKNYWNKSLQETGKVNKAHVISPQEQLRLSLINQYKYLNISNTIADNTPLTNRDLYIYDDLFSYNLPTITSKKAVLQNSTSNFYSYTAMNKNSLSDSELDSLLDFPFATLNSNQTQISNNFLQMRIYFQIKKMNYLILSKYLNIFYIEVQSKVL